jgi:hypothetical protein
MKKPCTGAAWLKKPILSPSFEPIWHFVFWHLPYLAHIYLCLNIVNALCTETASMFPWSIPGQAQPDSWQAFKECQRKELNCQVCRMNRRYTCLFNSHLHLEGRMHCSGDSVLHLASWSDLGEIFTKEMGWHLE